MTVLQMCFAVFYELNFRKMKIRGGIQVRSISIEEVL